MKIVKASNNTMPVRLREEPNGRIIGKIPQDTQVEILSTNGVWSEIETSDGKTGWMMSEFLVDTITKSNLSELKQKLKEVLELLDKMED